MIKVCYHCDEVCEIEKPWEKGKYKCPTCNHILFKYNPKMIEQILALCITAFILLVLANTFPFLAFEVSGNIVKTNLSTGVLNLFHQEHFFLAFTILFTIILIPMFEIIAFLLIFTPLYLNKKPLFMRPLIKFLNFVKLWGMMEIFFIGILVSIVKLIKMGEIILGEAMWAFIFLIIIRTIITTKYDSHQLWEMK